jgi:hypothetical protein
VNRENRLADPRTATISVEPTLIYACGILLQSCDVPCGNCIVESRLISQGFRGSLAVTHHLKRRERARGVADKTSGRRAVLRRRRGFELSSALYTHEQLVKLGVETELYVWEGLFHGFFYNADIPESTDAFNVMIRFFDRHLGGGA